MELRIALTVLPVGPRGTTVLDANNNLWFALQISAGFSDVHDPAAIDKLWPWVLHFVDNGKITLNCFLLDNNGVVKQNIPHEADVLAIDDFTKGLRSKIETIYADASLRQTLDMRLLLPAEVQPDKKEEHERDSFPARVQYLATLPGELSRRLLATVYVQVPTVELFSKSTGTWKEKEKTLWVAPVSVNGSTKITFTADPVRSGAFFMQTETDAGVEVVPVGPGFTLSDFITPGTNVFHLDSYEVAVNSGDRRYIELDSFLLNVLDPFAELHAVRDSDVRSGISLKATAGTSRVIAEETFDALVDAWRVRAFADALSAMFPDALDEMLTLMLPQMEPRPTLNISARWGTSFADELKEKPLALADKLATRIGVTHAADRATLKRVSERAGFAEVARLLAQAFDETLNATASATKPLLDAWRFGDRFKPAELAERRATVALAAIAHIRERNELPPLMPALMAAGFADDSEELLHEASAAKLKERWAKRADSELADALASVGLAVAGEQLQIAADVDKNFADDYVDTIWPKKPEPAAELPGRGLSLRLGDAPQCFVHEDNTDADATTSPYREVAGVVLLGRRGSDLADVASQPWRILTAGAAMIGETKDRLFVPTQIDTKEWLHELLPLPLRPVFQQKIMRADVEYHGQPMLARSALDHAYDADAYLAEDAGGLDAAYSFHPIGNFDGELPDAAKASRAPALRYGDVYQFRGGVIDQAGGLPRAIADDNEPWRIDVPKLIDPSVAGSNVPYRRAVPPGDVNILPGPDPDPNVKQPWPALPDDVALRAREFRALDHGDADSLPAVLLRGESFGNALREYRFRIVPPVIDEHTLMRWAIPALGDTDAVKKQKIADLKSAFAELLDQRASATAVHLHDPAVAGLGIIIRASDNDNNVSEIFRKIIEPMPHPQAKPFQRQAVPVRLAAAPLNDVPQATGDASGIEITLPEGSFAVIEVFPLVTAGDYTTRFLDFKDLVDESAPFAGHAAFHPSVVLAESATTKLPDEKVLYKHLELLDQDGQIAVRFKTPGDIKELVFVDRFAIERDRWIWRNLPVVAMSVVEDSNTTDDERRRLVASGPPDAAFKKDERDDSPAVAEWERIASIDRGFADRGEIGGRWPRAAAAPPFLLLASDNRDAVPAADYLRFGLRVRSRYAGVLPEKSREVPQIKGKARRRRILTGFRGQKVKPPKILGIVPLTASLDDDPLKTSPEVPPFLVLLDESFFREYGVGERIDIHLTLENLDIGEKPDAELPYRAGPLPDHWLRSQKTGVQRYYDGKKVTTKMDEASPIPLDVFGPFGYSLDLTPSEALANATAFVAYPPPKAAAHWAMFVRLRRRLDRPSAGQFSDFSDTHALYTLPNARLLASGNGRVELTKTLATLRDLRFVLDPTAQPAAPTEDPRKNSEASSQYRYFLLVSRVVAGAGQGFDAEIPAGLWRMPLFTFDADPNKEDGYQQPGTYDVEFRSKAKMDVEQLTQDLGTAIDPDDPATYRGRVLEVMINGRYKKSSRIDAVQSWSDFWTSLLTIAKPEEEVDAAGMIRRISHPFEVVMG